MTLSNARSSASGDSSSPSLRATSTNRSYSAGSSAALGGCLGLGVATSFPFVPRRVRLAIFVLRLSGLRDWGAFLEVAAGAILPPPEGVQSTDWMSVVRVPAPLLDGLQTNPGGRRPALPLKALQLLFVRSSPSLPGWCGNPTVANGPAGVIPPGHPDQAPPAGDRQ